jgi:hypothetical protein
VKAIGRLEPGDVLVVTRLDRLARSTRDLLNVIAAIADRGAEMWRRDSDQSRPHAGTFSEASTSNRPTIKQINALVTSEAHGQPWAWDSSHRVCM